MVAPLSEVPKEGSSVFSLFSLIKLHLASLPLASSYSHVAVSSVFCAQSIFFSAQTRGAPLNNCGTIYCMVIKPGKVANPARGQLNRENNIPLSPCVPENLVSRDGFSRPVLRQPAHLHTQAESGAYLRDSSRVPRRRPFKAALYTIVSRSPFFAFCTPKYFRLQKCG